MGERTCTSYTSKAYDTKCQRYADVIRGINVRFDLSLLQRRQR